MKMKFQVTKDFKIFFLKILPLLLEETMTQSMQVAPQSENSENI